MKHLNRLRSAAALLIAGISFAFGSTLAQAADPATAPKPSAFFPFCIDWHDAKKRSFTEQATMLKELGYDGVGHIWLDKVAERIKTLDDAGLKLFQITMPVNVAPGKPAYDPRFKEVLALIKGRHVQFCLLVNGFKPSDPAGDARAVEILREMSGLASESGAQLLLYPHVNNWIERIEDSVRVAEKVDRPNVGVMFNLCHWLRADSQRDYKPLLEKAMPRLWAISINGADERDKTPGWTHYIQPLGRGSFDVFALLKTLRELGYAGPVGLQCFGIGGDTRDHLAESMKTWREYSARLASLEGAAPSAPEASISVGGGLKLKPSSWIAEKIPLHWTSSDPAVAEIFQNGWVVGLKPGKAVICVNDGDHSEKCSLTVTAVAEKPRDPDSIKQFTANKRFELDGRLCFGSELNGHVPGVPHKGFLESNRIINPAPLNVEKKLMWEVAPATEVVDGAGVRMGVVAPSVNVGDRRVAASAFNFGMSKVIRGRLYVYGFGAEVIVDPAIKREVDGLKDGVIATSAWVPFDSVVDKETLIDRFGVGRGKLPALPLESERWRVTGGDPKAYMLPEGELAIVKEANGPVPSHYLRRPSGTINILYSVPGYGLGGQGLDSFLLRDRLTFRAARGARSFVQPTYYPLKHPKAKEAAPRTMTFVYGAVEARGCAPVFGWVAKEALEPMR